MAQHLTIDPSRGHEPGYEARVEACRLRVRPILMTSFGFIFGVVPMLVAVRAGAERRRLS